MNMEEAQSRLTALSAWLDEANADRPQQEATILRFLKVGEEAGEMFAEVIGWTGQNPRKGVTANLEDVIEEALDVAITALGAVEHATGNRGGAFPLLFRKIQDVDARRLGTPGPIASDVKIDKFLERDLAPLLATANVNAEQLAVAYLDSTADRSELVVTDADLTEPHQDVVQYVDSAGAVVFHSSALEAEVPLASRIGHDHSSTDPWSLDGNGKATAYLDGCLIQESASKPPPEHED